MHKINTSLPMFKNLFEIKKKSKKSEKMESRKDKKYMKNL